MVAFCLLRLYNLLVFILFVPMHGKDACGIIKHGHGKTKIKIDHFRNNFLHIIILLPYYRVLAGFWDPMKLFFHPRVWLTLNWICPSHFRSVDSTCISSFKYIKLNPGNYMATNRQWVQKIWLYYSGRLNFYYLRSVMANTPYTPFTFFDQLFSLINIWNINIAYSNNWKKLFKIFLQYMKLF